MSSTPDPQQPSSSEGGGTPGTGDTTPADQPGAAPPGPPVYYRPGPSSGHYPQYPQNPYAGQAYGNHPYGQQVYGQPGTTPPVQQQPAYPQPYGQAQYGQAAQYSQPQYGQAQYGQPAGTGWAGAGSAVPRPTTMVTSLVLLLLAALPFLAGGLAVSFVPLEPGMFPPEAGLDQVLAQTGVGFTEFVSLVRTMGVVMAVLAALYMLLAVVAFTGRAGARLALTVLTALFGLFLLFAVVGSLGDPVGLAVPLLVLAASVAGVVLMFGAPAKAWFASKRT